MASNYPPRVGAVFAERYQLRELLGGGGVGQVFRAWDVQAQRLVALKAFNPAVVTPTTWANYVKVIFAATTVRHPDLVLPQGLSPTLTAAPLAVMDALTGDDLARLRARTGGKVQWTRALEIGARCAEVLHAVYTATGVAHRDLKATNVLVTQDGAIKVLDFGVVEFDAQSADRTRVDTALGVVDYKSPEQLESNACDARSDVFSLAVLIYEMIAGQLPFVGPSYFEVARKILLQPAPPLAEVVPDARVPPAVDALLQRALAKRPADRFGDLAELQKALMEQVRVAPRITALQGRSDPFKPAPRAAPAGRAKADEDDLTTTQLAPRANRGPRKPRDVPSSIGAQSGRTAPQGSASRPPTGRSALMAMPAQPSDGRTVVAGAGPVNAVPAADRTVVHAQMPSAEPPMVGIAPNITGSITGNITGSVGGTVGGRGSTVVDERRSRPGSTVVDEGRRSPNATVVDPGRRGSIPPPGAESTMILPDSGVPSGPGRPAPAEGTLLLPDDGARPAEGTLLLPEDGAARPAEGTLMLGDDHGARPEGTMQIEPTAATPGGWTLQKKLIAVNVICGVLILLGLVALVLSGCGPAGAGG